jgi:hypothetical protein
MSMVVQMKELKKSLITDTKYNTNLKSSDFMLYGLQLVFIHLKLSGAIDWSWIWVLSPLWIAIAIGLIMGFFISFFMRPPMFNIVGDKA